MVATHDDGHHVMGGVMAKLKDLQQVKQMLDKIDENIPDEEQAILVYTEMSKLAGRLGFHGPAHILTLMAADEARHREHLQTMRQIVTQEEHQHSHADPRD